jgi:hypothetical protein
VKPPTFAMGECQICDDIWQMFADPENAKEKVVLGSLDQALTSPCPKHKSILESLSAYVNNFDSSTIHTIYGPKHRGSSASLTWLIDLRPNEWQVESRRVFLLKKEDIADHHGTAQILNPEWINLDLLKHWVDQCCKLHPTFTTAMNTTPTVPALLVDVRKKRVVSGVSGCRYVALSYRFGEAAHFRLDRELLDALRHDFALDNLDILNSLPLTVRHAMALVNALGESYLWTDSLCITHKDPSALSGQLEQMAAIYSSALFTTVATNGDGTSGISGLTKISEPRQVDQEILEFGDENLVIIEPQYFGLIPELEYRRRGWTYQEYLMSGRKLIFRNGQAHWKCQCSEWHEDLARDVEVNKSPDRHLQHLVAGLPDLASLGDLLNDYNERSLTYDEDALPAIAGLLSVLSRTFTGGFLYGLPEMMFDTALGWDAIGNMTKRVPSQPGHRGQDMPTWSWLSWRGMSHWRHEEMRVRDVIMSFVDEPT